MTLNQTASTVGDFCRRYRIDRSSYYRNLKLGRMPAFIKVGGSTRILKTDEEAWLAKQRGASAEEGAR